MVSLVAGNVIITMIIIIIMMIIVTIIIIMIIMIMIIIMIIIIVILVLVLVTVILRVLEVSKTSQGRRARPRAGGRPRSLTTGGRRACRCTCAYT